MTLESEKPYCSKTKNLTPADHLKHAHTFDLSASSVDKQMSCCSSQVTGSTLTCGCARCSAPVTSILREP